MVAARRLYLDTNVFIALKEGGGSLADLLIDLIAKAPANGDLPFLATSEFTLAELLPKPFADRRQNLIDQYDSWLMPSSWLEVAPVSRDVLWNAAILRSQHRALKLPDAIHVSTAFNLGCSHLLTGDIRLQGGFELLGGRHGGTGEPLRIEGVNLDQPTVSVLVAQLPA